MKIKLLSTLVFFSSQISFSQIIGGKVVSNNYTIPKVDIINANSKALTVSDANGRFSIAAKMDDTLTFIAKNYELKKIVINPFITDDTDLTIELTLKAEELKEVIVPKIEHKMTWLTKEEIEQIKLNSSRPKQDLRIIDYKESPQLFGIDFIRIGRQFNKLFKKDKATKSKSQNSNFKNFTKENCSQTYFLETLKLKSEEIEIFLIFCETDPKSKTIAEEKNILSIMDFLFNKNQEFKKLQISE
ncbi:hypothetical protein B6A10_03420 [Flavobacterium sp. L1I52]|uniref:CarboxypepD_reg-like domain-containing protein n=1 Tax=Flavobacterium pokkalii TaxID=1940408 RepID=A0ABR7UP53_9FLAO|nr:hypothetical protein [Flavobacterium pokkalii]MBD0724221.1 hypothetical protein [Flavobacterium pokkalii]